MRVSVCGTVRRSIQGGLWGAAFAGRINGHEMTVFSGNHGLAASVVAIYLCLGFAGCGTFSGGGDGLGKPVRFDPMPPRSVQTQSLRDVRFRRFSPNEGHNQSEWSGEPSIWPVDHPDRIVISRYGPRGRANKIHSGIDIKAPRGTPVVATADGTVSYAGIRSGYGNVIEIDHGDGVASVYGHLDAIEVDLGIVVHQGEEIGRVGSTGNATTPHVHYEVHIDSQTYDPWLFLPAVAS